MRCDFFHDGVGDPLQRSELHFLCLVKMSWRFPFDSGLLLEIVWHSFVSCAGDFSPAGFLHFQSVCRWLNHWRCRIKAVRVGIRFADVLEIHAKPHDGFLDFGYSQRSFAASLHEVIGRAASCVTWFRVTFEVLQHVIELFAELFCLGGRRKFCGRIWCAWVGVHCVGICGCEGRIICLLAFRIGLAARCKAGRFLDGRECALRCVREVVSRVHRIELRLVFRRPFDPHFPIKDHVH